jgi:hypothetical protein
MAGVDSANQFPNSFMARAVKLGQSRMVSDDFPSIIQVPSQDNVSIAVATLLTIPNTNPPVTYAIITAIGGPLYATYDGSTPSAANYAITIAAGAQLPVQGADTLSDIMVFGTSMSVSYWT